MSFSRHGKSILPMCAKNRERHRNQEWLKFLRLIDERSTRRSGSTSSATIMRRTNIHACGVGLRSTSVSMCTLRPPGVVAEHDRAVFRDLTDKRIRRGVFQDFEQLIMAIGDYIDKHNANPKPFIWTAKANDILEKVTRAQAALNNRLSV